LVKENQPNLLFALDWDGLMAQVVRKGCYILITVSEVKGHYNLAV